VLIASLLVTAVAFAAGYLAHQANPYGIFLYTPPDWCAGKRTNAFSLVYAVILWSAAAVVFAAAVFLCIRQSFLRREVSFRKLVTKYGKAFRVTIVLIVFSALANFIQLFFPIDIEPKCRERGSSRKDHPLQLTFDEPESSGNIRLEGKKI
jgi:hypothetical protein